MNVLLTQPGDCFRLKMKGSHGFYVWKITGLHYGALGHENLITFKLLSGPSGSAYGKTVKECVVPLEMLRTHPGIEPV